LAFYLSTFYYAAITSPAMHSLLSKKGISYCIYVYYFIASCFLSKKYSSAPLSVTLFSEFCKISYKRAQDSVISLQSLLASTFNENLLDYTKECNPSINPLISTEIQQFPY
jgi:hypothetical protein